MQAQMQGVAIDKTIPRKALLTALSGARYPHKKRVLNACTLYRWCKLAGVPVGLSEYDLEQCALLSKVANLKRQGYDQDQIRVFLGVQPHDRTTQSTQSPQSEASTSFDFNPYTNPYQ